MKVRFWSEEDGGFGPWSSVAKPKQIMMGPGSTVSSIAKAALHAWNVKNDMVADWEDESEDDARACKAIGDITRGIAWFGESGMQGGDPFVMEWKE